MESTSGVRAKCIRSSQISGFFTRTQYQRSLNQATAYRTGMDDATIRDENNLLYTNPDNPYALPISILPEGRYLPA